MPIIVFPRSAWPTRGSLTAARAPCSRRASPAGSRASSPPSRRSDPEPAMTRLLLFLAAICALALPSVASAERVRDIGQFQSVRSNQLTGYGIVVGLDGTGDDNFAYATQAMRGVSGRLGLQLPPGVALDSIVSSLLGLLTISGIPAYCV